MRQRGSPTHHLDGRHAQVDASGSAQLLQHRLDLRLMTVPCGPVRSHDPAPYGMMRALVRVCATLARSYLHVDHGPVGFDDARFDQRHECQDRHRGVATAGRDAGRITNRVPIQLGETVDERSQQVRPSMWPVVALVECRIGEPEVRAQVDEAPRARRQFVPPARCLSVWQGEDEDVGFREIVGLAKAKVGRTPEVRMRAGDRLPGEATRGNASDRDFRVADEKPQQLAAPIPRAPENRHPGHATEPSTVGASSTLGASTCPTT